MDADPIVATDDEVSQGSGSDLHSQPLSTTTGGGSALDALAAGAMDSLGAQGELVPSQPESTYMHHAAGNDWNSNNPPAYVHGPHVHTHRPIALTPAQPSHTPVPPPRVHLRRSRKNLANVFSFDEFGALLAKLKVGGPNKHMTPTFEALGYTFRAMMMWRNPENTLGMYLECVAPFPADFEKTDHINYYLTCFTGEEYAAFPDSCEEEEEEEIEGSGGQPLSVEIQMEESPQPPAARTLDSPTDEEEEYVVQPPPSASERKVLRRRLQQRGSKKSFRKGEDDGFSDLLLDREAEWASQQAGDSLVVVLHMQKIPRPKSEIEHYDSKEQTGYVGLANQGATCYMNSLLQSLFHIPRFAQAVYLMPTTPRSASEAPVASVAGAMQSIFFHLQTHSNAASTKALTEAFGWTGAQAFIQHDVQEFSRVLSDKLEKTMKDTVVDGMIGNLFQGESQMYVECLDSNYKSCRREAFQDVALNVKGCRSVQESFDQYVKEEIMDGENQYRAADGLLHDARKGSVFLKFPPVLQLQLKRFEYDYHLDQMTKVNSRFSFDEELDLSKYRSQPKLTEEETEAEQEKPAEQRQAEAEQYQQELTEDPDQYYLHSVLVHSGGVGGGHYYGYVRPFLFQKEEKYSDCKWYKFDDDTVEWVAPEEAQDQCFGGRRSHANAYMLVYVRKSEADKCGELLEEMKAKLPQATEEEEKEEKEAQEGEREADQLTPESTEVAPLGDPDDDLHTASANGNHKDAGPGDAQAEDETATSLVEYFVPPRVQRRIRAEKEERDRMREKRASEKARISVRIASLGHTRQKSPMGRDFNYAYQTESGWTKFPSATTFKQVRLDGSKSLADYATSAAGIVELDIPPQHQMWWVSSDKEHAPHSRPTTMLKRELLQMPLIKALKKIKKKALFFVADARYHVLTKGSPYMPNLPCEGRLGYQPFDTESEQDNYALLCFKYWDVLHQRFVFLGSGYFNTRAQSAVVARHGSGLLAVREELMQSKAPRPVVESCEVEVAKRVQFTKREREATQMMEMDVVGDAGETGRGSQAQESEERSYEEQRFVDSKFRFCGADVEVAEEQFMKQKLCMNKLYLTNSLIDENIICGDIIVVSRKYSEQQLAEARERFEAEAEDILEAYILSLVQALGSKRKKMPAQRSPDTAKRHKGNEDATSTRMDESSSESDDSEDSEASRAPSHLRALTFHETALDHMNYLTDHRRLVVFKLHAPSRQYRPDGARAINTFSLELADNMTCQHAVDTYLARVLHCDADRLSFRKVGYGDATESLDQEGREGTLISQLNYAREDVLEVFYEFTEFSATELKTKRVHQLLYVSPRFKEYEFRVLAGPEDTLEGIKEQVYRAVRKFDARENGRFRSSSSPAPSPSPRLASPSPFGPAQEEEEELKVSFSLVAAASYKHPIAWDMEVKEWSALVPPPSEMHNSSRGRNVSIDAVVRVEHTRTAPAEMADEPNVVELWVSHFHTAGYGSNSTRYGQPFMVFVSDTSTVGDVRRQAGALLNVTESTMRKLKFASLTAGAGFRPEFAEDDNALVSEFMQSGDQTYRRALGVLNPEYKPRRKAQQQSWGRSRSNQSIKIKS